MVWAAAIPAVVNLIGKVVDRAIPDKQAAKEIKAQVTAEVLAMDKQELQAATSVILAEARGESWLQRNWRPMTALTFASLVVLHWIGMTPENLSEQEILKLMDIVQVMIGGYTVMRGGEKMMRFWTEAQTAKKLD